MRTSSAFAGAVTKRKSAARLLWIFDMVFLLSTIPISNEAPPQTDEVYGRLPKILVDSA
jgi:hypothetical protein